MKQIFRIFTIVLIFSSVVSAQNSPQFEFSTAFPFHAFQSSPREYFLTTKYSGGITLTVNDYTDFISTVTYTQQNVIKTQIPSYWISALTDSRTIYVPFTSDPFFSEYGVFTGVRFVSSQNIAQVFVKGQLGMLAAKYGTITSVMYKNPDEIIGGSSYRNVEGDVMKIQIAAMYGAGMMFHPISSLTVITELHAINRFTNQPLDVYSGVGIQFGL